MKKLEVIKVEIDTIDYSFRYTGKPAPSNSIVTNVEEMLEEELILEVKNHISKMETLASLPKGASVYFDSAVIFPRKKFKKCFGENKIVHKIENAEVVIIDMDRMTKDLSTYWARLAFPCTNGHYTFDSMASHIDKLKPGKSLIVNPHYFVKGTFEGFIERVEEVKTIIEKKVLNITNLSLCSEEELDATNFVRIHKMFQGTDDSMRNLAMNLLTAYDYEKEKHRIMALLALSWRKWERGQKKINIEIKSMLRKLKLDCDDFNSSWNFENHRGTTFWLNLILKHPDDEVIQAAFGEWTNQFLSNEPFTKFKLVKL